MTSSPTVFLVDDDQSVREALKWLIESIGLAVEMFDSADAFLQAFNADRPGCALVDVRMAGISGLELQDRLKAQGTAIPVIVMTGHGDVPMCIRAFEGGAFAFLEKPVNQQQLLDYIQSAIDADRRNRTVSSDNPLLSSRLQKLTEREREVMDLLVAGKSMKQISGQLDISLPTCSKHRSRVLEKMEVENDVELVRLVLTDSHNQVRLGD